MSRSWCISVSVHTDNDAMVSRQKYSSATFSNAESPSIISFSAYTKKQHKCCFQFLLAHILRCLLNKNTPSEYDNTVSPSQLDKCFHGQFSIFQFVCVCFVFVLTRSCKRSCSPLLFYRNVKGYPGIHSSLFLSKPLTHTSLDF